ncbi:serine-rich adhesin for platelets [Calliphora vicina]|uniref:serine-rich adhesin for platelets n=1 Tax=Calliphora vicina TaxID=7373 RepID=UPI00325ACE84
MYDKSKKTWSQRLKIHKNEKSQATTGNNATSITTTATNNSQQYPTVAVAAATKNPHTLEATLNVAHNVNSSSSRAPMPQYQLAPTAIMHLPTLSDYHASGAGTAYEYMPNHMSRSMKYAEPWIYGTVRGIPARPAGIYHPAYAHYAAHPHAATIFAAPTNDLATGAPAATAVAVVLCSCHEYLSGTKGRTLKKPSICKKCKGTRLPLHNIGGTVRLPTNLPSPKLRPVGAASTVRVVSTSKKMRPTILDPQKDPYDLMRRTRLLSPEPGSINDGGGVSAGGTSGKDKSRQRGKSASPVRGRSRTRHHKVLANSTISKESSKALENFDDTWLTESEDLAHTASSSAASSSRRSILRCNVNPYDLISINNQASSHNISIHPMESKSSAKEVAKKSNRKQKLQFSQNEFMPPNDDFNVQDAALTEDEPPFMHRTTKVRVESSKPDNNKKLIEEPPPPNTPPQTKKPNYINVQAIAGQRISLGEEQQAPKSLLQQTADGTTTYESFAIESEPQTISKEMEKTNKTRPDTLQVQVSLGEPKRPPRVVKQPSHSNDSTEIANSKETTEEEEELMVTVTVTPTYNIKSILKRPTSKTSENGENTQTDSVSKTHYTPSTPSKQRESGNNSKSSTPTNSRRNQVTINSTTANSQFYIPMPQARKKVQFLVEDMDQTGSEDLDDEDSFYDNSSSTSPNSLAGDLNTNYEYYSKKRNLKKLVNVNDQNENMSEDSETEIITYDEQFIQAMLLEKLQLDSELVTKRFISNNQQQEQNGDKAAAAANNNKTDYNDVAANGEQNKSQYNRQQDKNQNELERQEEKYDDKHYINENLGKAKTSLPLSTATLTANEQTFQSSTAATALNPQSSTNSACSSTPLELATHNRNKSYNKSCKNDDIDDYECLPFKDNNDYDEENIIIATVYEECDDGNNNVSNNSDSDDGLHNNVAASTSAVDADDDNDDQHLPDDVLLLGVGGGDGVVAVDDVDDGSSYADKPPTCHRNDNNHSQDDDNDDDAVDDDDDNVNISTSLLPVSKVQHNGAKKSTTSDYDDDAKTKQPQQQQQKQQQQKCTKKTKKDMQALAAVADSSTSSSSSNVTSCSSGSSGSKNRKISTKETQSRNPIRRSQSERQPTTTAPTMRTTTTYHNSTNNNTNNSSNKKKKDQQLHHDTAHVDNGGSSGSNENIIPNTRNSLKDIENIPNNINDSRSADCAGSGTVRRSVGGVGMRGNGNKTSLHFHDTMALRNRYNRNDTRDLFSMALIGRPREPPPPPPLSSSTPQTPAAAAPPSSPAVDMANARTPVSNSLPKAVELKESTKSTTTTLATDAIETSQLYQQQILNGLESNSSKQQQLEQKLTITTIAANNTIFCKEINEATLIEDKPKRHQQQQMVELTNSEKTTTDLSSQSSSSFSYSSKEQHTILPTTSNGNNKQQQRTVVRVAPFNKNSSEIHRLKISHTDNNDTYPHSPQTPKTPNTPNSTCSSNSSNMFACLYASSPFSNSSHYSVTDLSTLNASNEYGQKKTSILINGDDCYSTMNLSCDDSCTPLYQSSVVVTDGSTKTDNDLQGLRVTNTYNTVTINVSSPRSSEDELIHHHNQLNNLLKRQAKSSSATGSIRAIIPIRGTIDINLQRSASSTSSTSTSSITSSCSSASSSSHAGTSKRGKTLIRLDYEKEKPLVHESKISSTMINEQLPEEEDTDEWLPHETELLKILRNPVEAVKRNLVPHICKLRETDTQKDAKRSKKMKERHSDILESSVTSSSSSGSSSSVPTSSNKTPEASSTFIGKLLEDPMLQQVAEGLETDTVAELIENSLKRLQESRSSLDMTGTKDKDDMNRLIDLTLKRIQEERNSCTKETSCNSNLLSVPPSKDEERLSNRGSISSANSFASAHNYELFDFEANESDCYQSCSSDINSIMEEEVPSPETKTKFYQMLVDATLQEIELSTNIEDLTNDEHQYESIRHNIDPIYEEIYDVPPPLPLTAPPLNDPELEKKSARSIFEGASKYDILSYLVDAKERGLVKEEPFDYPLNCSNPIIIEEESSDTLSDLGKLNKLKRIDTISSRSSIMSDSSDDNQSTMSSLSPPTTNNFMLLRNKQATSDIERNDSGVGSETSKSSRSKFLNPTMSSSPSPTSNSSSPISHQHSQPRSSPIHLCEDCDGPVETQIAENGHIFAPLVCRKCGKKRVERKEIITEVVETEEKYGRDLQIILEEFCHPMLVAGLLTQEQLSAIFLNTEELLENNQTLAERMRDALDIALEQGDDDLLTVNIGKIFLESTQMLHAFESYCVRQAGASLLLANLEKEKELLRIFLKVSQMENAVLRRMNLNSFLMVPVQRVTKYPLLLARLYKVTPAHLEGRDQLKQAQEKIELHLNHINQEAKDVPTKLWRRISSSSPNRRASCEIDMINIKLRKMAIDVLEWNHDEVRFVMEGKLLYTQPTDSNWKKARTIKLTTVNALLVTNGKPSTNYKAEKVMSDKLNFPKHTGIREASLLVVKEKCGRYTLIREPLYLDRCVVCSEADWDEYFEIQEISSKDTFIFKAEDNVRTKQWYTQLQYHAQGMGAWRKRRNALANIMINGMLTRS